MHRQESIFDEIDRLSDDEEAQGEEIMAMKRAKTDADYEQAGKVMESVHQLADAAAEIEGLEETL